MLRPVDFKSKTFHSILKDMTTNMNALLRDMENMGASDGKLTLAITVHLEQKENEEDVAYTSPTFCHKIKSGFNVQHQDVGIMEGEYALRKAKNGKYDLEVISDQMSIFEDEEEDEED